MLTRRTLVSAALVGLGHKTDRPLTGGFVNDSFRLGHSLRDRVSQPAPKQTVRTSVVIVGGGIAGLSAGWHLHRSGFSDFVLLEMEKDAGGNSRWGENEVSAYPWAAHYLPLPSKQSGLVRELMEELGALQNGTWEERYLCFSPQERVFLHGRWQEGLEPEVAATRQDREELKRFEEVIDEMRGTGSFTLPMEAGAKKTSALDLLSMRDWLRQQGFKSPYLHWYVDYACRDDYGAHLEDVSAWAGIHYFAAREHGGKGPLTWPEGNGWIVRKLSERLRRYVRTNTPVYRVSGNRVFTPGTVYIADKVIWAAPSFVARYVIEGATPAPFVYSPWLTANLTLHRMPRDIQNGAEPAWDNVIYGSPALGYVVATHMNVSSRAPERSVWTWYMALADGTPAQNRTVLLERSWADWTEFLLQDLSRAHPDIRECVSHIDIMRMGHAMARPVVGMLGSPSRLRFVTDHTILYANSDLSGFSVFEEAQYRGVMAAKRAMKSVGAGKKARENLF